MQYEVFGCLLNRLIFMRRGVYNLNIEMEITVGGGGLMDNRFDDTMQFRLPTDGTISAEEIVMNVYSALRAKGYDPITQIVGYIISGDPTYITSHNGARSLIRRLERDEILDELVRYYVKRHEVR